VEIEQLKNLMKRLGELDFKSKFQLFRDPVTELFNEEFFLTRLELAFERANRRPEFQFAVVALEFQMPPGKDGQTDPDAIVGVLREIALRLKSFVRPTDAVARISGWKFATLHEDLKQPGDLQVILSRLEEKLSKPYAIGEESLDVKFRLGAVLHDPIYEQPNDILKAAEKAISEGPVDRPADA
jgi:diguanylate cyclase (GGDEF)-like protein